MSDASVDPVAAYDAVASSFPAIVAERRAYLDAIDALVTTHLPPGARTLLDVGSGDARRSRKIASAGGISTLVLAEPSAGMRCTSSSPDGYVDLRAENLSGLEGQFDVILCLWNVLGHIFPHSARTEVLRQFHRLLSPDGKVFVDVNHRYNAVRYGLLWTAGRFVFDRLRPSEKNGDVVATWRMGSESTSVHGHVFTDAEFRSVAGDGGLHVDRRFVVDYETGSERSHSALGNLLYIMKRRQLAALA